MGTTQRGQRDRIQKRFLRASRGVQHLLSQAEGEAVLRGHRLPQTGEAARLGVPGRVLRLLMCGRRCRLGDTPGLQGHRVPEPGIPNTAEGRVRRDREQWRSSAQGVEGEVRPCCRQRKLYWIRVRLGSTGLGRSLGTPEGHRTSRRGRGRPWQRPQCSRGPPSRSGRSGRTRSCSPSGGRRRSRAARSGAVALRKRRRSPCRQEPNGGGPVRPLRER